MNIKEYPNLLILKNLIAPIDNSLKKLDNCISNISEDIDDVLIEGLFVLSISSVEIMLSDILKYFYRCFPLKLPKNGFQFDKDTFFNNQFDLIDKSIEGHIMSLSYKSYKEYFDIFLEQLSLEWKDYYTEFGDYIEEIKATRNLLLHNNLVVNEQYIGSAGIKKRSNSISDKLTIKYDYALSSLKLIIEFEKLLKAKIVKKYKIYTKVNANKRFWGFIFKSPVMPYDDFWIYDEQKDEIIGYKEGKYEGALSGSEVALLGLWRAHFAGSGSDHLKNFHMRRFDNKNREKVLFFLSTVHQFNLY